MGFAALLNKNKYFIKYVCRENFFTSYHIQPNKMNAEEYLLLYEKYISGLCNAEEEKRLFDHQDNFHLLPADTSEADQEHSESKSIVYARIVETISEVPKRTFHLFAFYKIAAVLLVATGIGLLYNSYFVPVVSKTAPSKQNYIANAPIRPGRNTAQLRLSNGTVVDLDQVNDKFIVSAGQAKIRKYNTGSIAYASNNSSLPANATNTITVPAGGNYNVILPDGTSVWLNSVSSLTYPVNFKGKTRSVSLQGEAYFEVTKNPDKPFVVQVNAMRVTVLGTHFNVNAYQEHHGIQTSLLEGSVRLSQASEKVTLVPGEQGTVDRESSNMNVAKVNMNKVVGWKNGYFMFQDDNIKDIMEQIARWYDVDVEYRGDLHNKLFGGIYSRNKDIKELLKGLELTGLVHFKIEGRRIIVMA
jgi:transmembrane sensor